MATTIPEQVWSAASDAADVEAVVDGDVRLTYPELAELSERMAAAFVELGVEPGERVAIWAPNSWRWIVAAFGVTMAGAILVPINTRYRGGEAHELLARSRARVLFVEDGFLGTPYVELLRGAGQGAGALLPGLPDLIQIADLGACTDAEVTPYEDLLASGSAASRDEARRRGSAVTPDDVSDILFTSGTTGRPKGAMCTHGQNLSTYESYTTAVGLRRADRYLMVNPFFHSFGYKAGVLASLLRRATMLPVAVFDVDRVLELVRQESVTVLPGAPTLYQTLLEHPDREGPLSPVRLAITGAASVPSELIRRIRSQLGVEVVITAYGLTEVCGTATTCQADDDPETVAERCGHPIPGVEVRIVDPEGRPVPTGATGEVLVRGFNVMRGYFEDQDATAQAIDEDGWLHTGDVGDLDERGYLRITDRLTDMFIVGGFNAYPAEIEQLLFTYPGVSDVAVIGVPDDRLGEVGKAFIVPRSGVAIDADDVIAFCRDNLANFKVPRFVEVVDALPRNAVGKILKHELRSH